MLFWLLLFVWWLLGVSGWVMIVREDENVTLGALLWSAIVMWAVGPLWWIVWWFIRMKIHLKRIVVPQRKIKPRVPTDGAIAREQGFKLGDNPMREYRPEHAIWRDEWLQSIGRFK